MNTSTHTHTHKPTAHDLYAYVPRTPMCCTQLSMHQCPRPTSICAHSHMQHICVSWGMSVKQLSVKYLSVQLLSVPNVCVCQGILPVSHFSFGTCVCETFVCKTVSVPDVCVSRGKLSVSHSSLGTCVCETLSVADVCVCLCLTHETFSHDRSHTQAHTPTIRTHAQHKSVLAQWTIRCPFWLISPDSTIKIVTTVSISVAICVRMHTCMRVCLSLHLDEAVTLPNTATHCNKLQHTATRCNTLQH